VLSFSELPPSLDGGLDDSELEYSSSSVCVEDELFSSFRLPLDFLEGVLDFSFSCPLAIEKHLLEGGDRFLLGCESYRVVPTGPGLAV